MYRYHESLRPWQENEARMGLYGFVQRYSFAQLCWHLCYDFCESTWITQNVQNLDTFGIELCLCVCRRMFSEDILQTWTNLTSTKILSKHTFYKTIYEADRECFNKLCSNAIFEETVDKGHEVFATGEEGVAHVAWCHKWYLTVTLQLMLVTNRQNQSEAEGCFFFCTDPWAYGFTWHEHHATSTWYLRQVLVTRIIMNSKTVIIQVIIQ